MIKHRQHYVWQHYLKAWCNADGLVHYSRNKKEPSTANPKNLMVERHFYKLQRLTAPDIEYLKHYIQKTVSPDLKSYYQELINLFVRVVYAHETIKDNDLVPLDAKTKIYKMLIETEDILHDATENQAVPILDQLRQKQSEFINLEKSSMVFFFYIAHQLFRTKNVGINHDTNHESMLSVSRVLLRS